MVRAAEAGRNGILLVEGEPGIGKTRFLEESAAAAAARGFTAAWGQAGVDEAARGTPASQLIPAPREEFLMPAAGDGSARGGPLWREPPTTLRQAQPGRGAQQKARGWPCWTICTAPTRPRSGPCAVWPGVHRPGRPSGFWPGARPAALAMLSGSSAIWSRAGAVRMPLGPVGDDVLAEMVAEVVGAVPDQELLALAAGAGGNPLLLTELLVGLRDEGMIRSDGGSARLVSGELPRRLRAVVQRWVSGLGPRARQLLAVGAILGRSFTVEQRRRAARRDARRSAAGDRRGAVGRPARGHTRNTDVRPRARVASGRRERATGGPSGAAPANG